MKDSSTSRRQFLKSSLAAPVAAGLSPAISSNWASAAPNDRINIAVMGTNSRGARLARTFAYTEGVTVTHICDVDSRAIVNGQEAAMEQQDMKPEGVEDFRNVLDDASVDALAIAAPDHWHTPAAILALQAGKHVYVEKPCSHNPHEGELLVQAQEKYGRVVQMGNQRRSYGNVREAIDRIQTGDIGRVYYAKSYYSRPRDPIGFGKPAEVPSWLNYELWQGPAPRQQYRDNLIHYNWHWYWHWGTGEAGNNGVHTLDLCRWGLDVDYPERTTIVGGKYHFQDGRETPDTQVVGFDFPGDKTIAWQGLSGVRSTGVYATFYGTEGHIQINGNGYEVFDRGGEQIEEVAGPDESRVESDGHHTRDFAQSIRENTRPNSFIEGGHKSTLLCHLGNIAWRTGRTLHHNPENGHIIGDRQAMKLWKRSYAPGWEPTV